MERLKKIGKALLWPHWAVIVLLCITSAALLLWVFLTGRDQTHIAYPIYVLSAYALTTVCCGVIPNIPKWWASYQQRKSAVPQADRNKRLIWSLYQSLGINLVYGLFQLVAAFFYRSTWMGSVGLYYIVLSLIRLVLALFERSMDKIGDPQKCQRRGWTGFQVCGFLLLALNLTMTGMVFQMIWRGMGSHYPQIMVYAVAAYTFYRLTMAVIRVIQYKGNHSPIQGAARNIELTAAMMSMFSLQTAMFSAFGGEFAFQQLMNTLTGGAVCLLEMLGAFGMVFHGAKKRKEATGAYENGDT